MECKLNILHSAINDSTKRQEADNIGPFKDGLCIFVLLTGKLYQILTLAGYPAVKFNHWLPYHILQSLGIE